MNGVNVEGDSHEDLFYRIKACVSYVTLLAVDVKTFIYCKKNGIDVCARIAEKKYSGNNNWEPGELGHTLEFQEGVKSIPKKRRVK